MKLIRSLIAVAALAGFAAGIGASRPAPLHLALSKAVPGADSTVTAAPRSIDLYFTQAPQEKATSVTLTGPSGGKVEVGPAAADAKDARILRAPIRGPVAPGSYTVAWRTMAGDGHVVRGEYRFTYKASAE